jgi:hypothetical protein
MPETAWSCQAVFFVPAFRRDGSDPPRALTGMRLTTLSLLAASSVLGTGCVDRPQSGVTPVGTHVETIEVGTVAESDVDILFVIDSSGSMTEEHAALRNDFGSLIARLDDLPDGMPNVHIGVVSSDLGTAPFNVDGNCRADGGDQGLLQGAACAALGGNRFLSDIRDPDGTRRRNYTGDLATAFGCMADVGSSGCGFEQHLEAMRVALSPGTNPDFLRPEAALAVIVIADEDDCSTSDPGLYDENASALGPLTDFRCHSQGIICDADPDPAAPGVKTGCRPDPDSRYLEPLETYVDFLIGLKSGHVNPERKVVVAGIIGDPDRVEIGRDSLDRPAVSATCPAGGLGASEPGIRLDAFLSRFAQSSVSTLCASDLDSALSEIGEVIGGFEGRMCLRSRVADRNPDLADVQAECSVTQVVGGAELPVPICGGGNVGRPCWSIVSDAECVGTSQRLAIDRGGAPPPEDGTIRVQCVVESSNE